MIFLELSRSLTEILNGTLSVLVVFCYHNFSDDVIAYAEV